MRWDFGFKLVGIHDGTFVNSGAVLLLHLALRIFYVDYYTGRAVAFRNFICHVLYTSIVLYTFDYVYIQGLPAGWMLCRYVLSICMRAWNTKVKKKSAVAAELMGA